MAKKFRTQKKSKFIFPQADLRLVISAVRPYPPPIQNPLLRTYNSYKSFSNHMLTAIVWTHFFMNYVANTCTYAVYTKPCWIHKLIH